MLKVITRSIFSVETSLSNGGIVRNHKCNRSGTIITAMRNYFKKKDEIKPPYHHVCQIGDPALRMHAEPVDPEVIPTAEFKKFVDHLISVMKKYETFGLSASQIGVSAQVFVIETTKEDYEKSMKTKCAGQQLEVVPLRVFINPKMKILDYETLIYPESCPSMCGYLAHVPRAKSIRIQASDLSGKSFVWDAHGWPARLAQHEIDHLQGKFFTDKMDPKTLSCVVWEAVNCKGGNIGIDFCPAHRSTLRKILHAKYEI